MLAKLAKMPALRQARSKGEYTDIVDVVVGMKAPRRGQPGFEGD
jgi:hypothetical protein